jgi:hypothetical protein
MRLEKLREVSGRSLNIVVRCFGECDWAKTEYVTQAVVVKNAIQKQVGLKILVGLFFEVLLGCNKELFVMFCVKF